MRDSGDRAEELARAHLEGRGLRTLTRNHRTRAGEIDLVMAEGDTLVIVEVRYRRRSDFGAPAETVDARKQGRLLRAAEDFLQRHPRWRERPVRFDVVAVAGGLDAPHVDWIRDAFGA